MNIKDSKFYPAFYRRYNYYRDNLIRSIIAQLKYQGRSAGNRYGIPRYLKWSKIHQRVAQAYWDARLANRPFINPKPVEYQRFVSPTREPLWNYREEDPYNPPEGFYFLVLDGREYEKLVTIDVDDENATVILRSKRG